MITFDAVTKRYSDGTTAVNALDLTIPDAAITVLVGPSGCGKTTSLRMVNRMVEPTSGRLLIDGQDIAQLEPTRLRQSIGYVIQHAGLFPHRTVLDNIATVPVLTGSTRRAARAVASNLLELVGLDAGIGQRYPSQLSGGQQQRVGVARALAGEPPILLMDEPFSAVDPIVRAELQDELLRLQRSLGKTIVFVTHDIDEAVKLGDRLAILAVGGRLAQFGSPADVLDRPADDFVARFVGRDRGYRALGFTNAAGVTVRDTNAVRLGDQVAAAGWTVVVDADDRPLGWVDLAAGTTVSTELVHLGGTLVGPDANARTVLDAVLSSPARRGVAVDSHGRLRGTIAAEDAFALAVAPPAPQNSAGTDGGS